MKFRSSWQIGGGRYRRTTRNCVLKTRWSV